MAIHIQPRDIRIMRQVYTFRVMTYDQVRRKFFADCYETVARNRLQKLIKYGYFKSFGMEIRGTIVRCLRLTEKAWPIISEKWSFHVDCPHFKSESIEHDVRLGEVILKFERLDLFERYFSENILQSSSTLKQDPVFSDSVNLQSDGVLVVKSLQGGSVVYAIEFEISKKAPDRYNRKLSSYYQANGLDGLLYICGNQEIVEAITQADRRVCTEGDSILYFATELSVLKSEDRIIFKGVDGGGIGLN